MASREVGDDLVQRLQEQIVLRYPPSVAALRPRKGGDVDVEGRPGGGEVVPLGEPVALHEEAGIELRVLPNLWPLWNDVVASTLEFSGIRLRNAEPMLAP